MHQPDPRRPAGAFLSFALDRFLRLVLGRLAVRAPRRHANQRGGHGAQHPRDGPAAVGAHGASVEHDAAVDTAVAGPGRVGLGSAFAGDRGDVLCQLHFSSQEHLVCGPAPFVLGAEAVFGVDDGVDFVVYVLVHDSLGHAHVDQQEYLAEYEGTESHGCLDHH